jgi:hypothetical protein
MSCDCHRHVMPVPHPPPHPSHLVPVPVGPGCGCFPKPHIHQSPTFRKRPAMPCGPFYFIPNQPPLPTFGCCTPPPPPQKGPWEYVPSRLYPDPFHHCGCHCHGPWPYFVPNQPWFPMPLPFPTYQCAPEHGCLPHKCYSMPFPVPYWRWF